jgi:hypothetical protein
MHSVPAFWAGQIPPFRGLLLSDIIQKFTRVNIWIDENFAASQQEGRSMK